MRAVAVLVLGGCIASDPTEDTERGRVRGNLMRGGPRCIASDPTEDTERVVILATGQEAVFGCIASDPTEDTESVIVTALALPKPICCIASDPTEDTERPCRARKERPPHRVASPPIRPRILKANVLW